MRVTTKGKYGLMMIVEIAANQDGKAIPLKAVSKKLLISEKYLEQIIIPLIKAGYVKSIRGAQGGYIIAKEPESLSVSQIIQVLEGEQCMRACIGEIGGCARVHTCAVIDVWREVNKAISKVLDNITLADLLNRREQKYEILKMCDALTLTSDDRPACNE